MNRSLVTLLVVALFTGGLLVAARANPPGTPGPAPAPASAVPAPSCKVFGSGSCCDPAIAAHLPKKAIYTACGETDATFLGEQAGKNACKYFFQVAGEKPGDIFVEVYAPPTKEVPPAPVDPFFTWKKVGKAFMIERANSPKAAAMSANSTGLWLPAKGYFVSINASTKVCSKKEATRLAASIH